MFESLSGGQQARFQVLLLELSGATLLLLDEPTDNLDVESAEALEAYTRAAALAPADAECQLQLGHALNGLGRRVAAVEAFRRAAALYPRMDRLQQAIDRLAPDVDGRDL